MRVMVIMKADQDTEAGVLPDERVLTAMGKFNEELVQAGVMLAGEGLQPSSKGARLRLEGAKRSVIRGPFPRANDLVAGFWMWKVASLDEAIDWAKRIPNPDGAEAQVELRPVFEAEDFGTEFTPGLQEQEARQRARAEQLNQRPGR